MQIGALNSVNFKGSSSDATKTIKQTQEELELTKKFLADTEKDLAVSKKLRETLSPNSNKEGDKKNAFEIIASIGVTFLAAFLLSKKLYKRGGEAVSQLKDKFISSGLKGRIQTNNTIQGIMTGAKNRAADISEKIPAGVKAALGRIKNIGFIKPVFDKTNANHAKAIANTVGVIGGAAGTAIVADTDSDGDGTKDIAQKSVKAIKGAIDKAGVISDLVKALT